MIIWSYFVPELSFKEAISKISISFSLATPMAISGNCFIRRSIVIKQTFIYMKIFKIITLIKVLLCLILLMEVARFKGVGKI